MGAERLGVHGVHRREVAKVGHEHHRLRDAVQRCAGTLQQCPRIGESLAGLCLDAGNQRSVRHPQLTRDDKPVSGSDNR